MIFASIYNDGNKCTIISGMFRVGGIESWPPPLA